MRRNIFYKKIWFKICIFFAKNSCYFCLQWIESVLIKYVFHGFPAINQIIYNQCFKICKIFGDFCCIPNLSRISSITGSNINSFNTLYTEKICQKICRQQTSSCNRNNHIGNKSAFFDLFCQ